MMKTLNDKKRIFLNSFFSTGATFIENIVFFIINIIFARYFTTAMFNEFTTALGYATFFTIFTELGLNRTLVRAINLEPEYEKEHLGNAIFLKSLFTFVIYMAIIFSAKYSNKFNDNTILLIYILGLSRMGNSFIMVFYAVFESKERFIHLSIFKLLLCFLYLIASVVIVTLHGSYFHIAFSRLTLVFVISFVMLIVIMKYHSFEFNFSRLGKFIHSGIPFGLSTIFKGSLLKMGIMVLALTYGEKYSGVFNNGYIILTAIAIIPGSLNTVLIPYLFKFSFKDNKQKYQFAFEIYSKFFIIISCFITLMLVLYSKDLIPLFFGDKYKPSIGILQVAAFSVPFFFTITETLIMVIDKQKVNLIIQLISFVFHIGANIILAYYFQAEGAAFSTVMAFFIIYLLSHLYLIYKRIISYKNVFFINIKILFILAISFFVYYMFLLKIHFILGIIANSILYLILVLIFVMTKKDIKLITDIIK